jgi:DNA-3-methyladenine glycosylase
MRILSLDFYERGDVLRIAQELLGKVIITRFNGEITSGIICETEAYNGVHDQASHAFGGRRTDRNEQMYQAGGRAYVYLCYGIHHLFNVVTNKAETPHAVLIRAIHPLKGLSTMHTRRGAKGSLSTGGPGTLTQALGIRVEHDGTDLRKGAIRIMDAGIKIPSSLVVSGPRIGVGYAGPDALLPYRYLFDPTLL